MSRIELRLFGYPEIRAGGRAVPLSLRKALAALIYIAEANGPVSRDSVATMLWPEADQTTAHARLRRMLHRMHQHLGTRVVAADRATLSIVSGLQIGVDTRAFEQACNDGDFEKASHLYDADFLEGFSVKGSPTFDEWTFFRREALRSRLIHALERVIEADRSRGRYRELIVHASRFVAVDPLNETAHRHLIDGYLLAGDGVAAQRQYESCALILKQELASRLPPPSRR